MSQFERLIRFETGSGEIFYGEAGSTDVAIGQIVPVFEGSDPWNLKLSTRKVEIKKARPNLLDI
jgi:hypothetical protein